MMNMTLFEQGGVVKQGGYQMGRWVSGAYRAIWGMFWAILAGFMVVLPASGALTITNGIATNITASNAVLFASLTATNSTNTTLTCYYGTGNGGTNTAFWQYSNRWGIAVCLTNVSITTTNILSGRTYYYYRWKAVGTNTAWAANSAVFTTLSQAVTSWPSVGTNAITQMILTNGLWQTPSRALVISANALATGTPVYVESDPKHTDWVATNTYVQSNSGNWAGTWQTYQPAYFRDWANITNKSVDIAGYGITDAWTKIESDARFGTTGNVAAVQADLDNHKTNTGVHAIVAVSGLQTALDGKATGMPVYVESDPVWGTASTGYYSKVEADGKYSTGTPVYVESDPVYGASVAAGISANDTSHWNTGATDASYATNWIATNPPVVGGSGFPLTNDVSLGGYTMRTGTFSGNLAGSTNLSHTNIVDQNGDTNYLHITEAEKLLTTNHFAMGAGTNILFTVDGGGTARVNNTYTYDDAAVLAATNALDAVANAALPTAGGIMTGGLTNNILFAGNGAGLTNIPGNLTAAEKILATNSVQTGGAGVLASLQITSGAPTNGAVLMATNALGQTEWKVYPKIAAENTTAWVAALNWNTLTYPTVINQVQGTWDGTNWTPGVVGYVAIHISGAFVSGGATSISRALYRNGVCYSYAYRVSDVTWYWSADWKLYNGIATNKYQTRMYTTGSAVTNDATVKNIFTGIVLP